MSRDTHPSRAPLVEKSMKGGCVKSDTQPPTKATSPGRSNRRGQSDIQQKETEMRDEPVPCVNATLYEAKRDMHMTWSDDRVCTVCQRTLDRFAARRARNEMPEKETV